MKCLILTLIFICSITARADSQGKFSLAKTCPTELGGLVLDGRQLLQKEIMVNEGRLLITFSGQVFWDYKPVVIRQKQRDFSKDLIQVLKTPSPVMLRMLLELVDHKNQYRSTDELFAEGWVNDAKQDQIEALGAVRTNILALRKAFEAVDPQFRSVVNAYSLGWAWDTGTRPENETFTLNGVTFHKGLREIYWNNLKVPLSQAFYDKVLLLVKNAGKRVASERIFQTHFLPSDATPTFRNRSSNVSIDIGKIRKAFVEVDETFDHIQEVTDRTEPFYGYMWRK